MGFIKAGLGALTGTLGDQWKEYFYEDSLPNTIIMTKGKKKTSSRSSNTNGEPNIISNGSKVAINDGQCAIIVDGGKIADIVMEPGEYVWDKSSQPSFFCGNLSENISNVAKQALDRFTFGGGVGGDQRVFYFNTKEINGICFGTQQPQDFDVCIVKGMLPVSVKVRFNGKYAIKILNPGLLYKEITGNANQYTMTDFQNAFRERFIQQVSEALSILGENGELRPAALNSKKSEIGAKVDQILSDKWIAQYGLDIVDIAFGGLDVTPESMGLFNKRAEEFGRVQGLGMLGPNGVAQAAMLNASDKEGNLMGGMMGAGLGMAMGQQMGNQMMNNQQPQQAQPQGIICPKCGAKNQNGKFCNECGQPLVAQEWTCECGAKNTGKFCSSCGKPKQ